MFDSGRYTITGTLRAFFENNAVIRRVGEKPVNRQYVEERDGAYRVVGTRVSLDSIVHAFWHGQTAESIAQSFPVLTLEQVYGALTFYLANRSDIDAYLKEAESEFETMRKTARGKDPMFYQKIADARRHHEHTPS
jgi:uncharacterized protein (DUF433 family)